MRINVRVKPGSKSPFIRQENGVLVAAVREPAIENRANDAVRLAIAEHLDVAPSRVRLIRGATSRIKVFEVV